jgi:HEAT repeat protein
MLEIDVLDIVTKEEPRRGDHLNEILDEFREGRNPREILALLDAEHSEVVSIGAWMLGELSFAAYASDEFVSRLRHLLDHSNAGVRFHALSAIFPALDGSDEETRKLLERLCKDANDGVRVTAQAAAARLACQADGQSQESSSD